MPGNTKVPRPPKWMLAHPAPEREERTLSGATLKGWLGWVPLEQVRAYVDNRRTDRQVATLKKTLQRVPSDDELFDFFKGDPELDIERLAENIMQNGLRVPLIISYDGVLLDGNRRYFAHRHIATFEKAQIRQKFEKVQAWVLDEEFSDPRNQLRVVTEYNFLDDLKIDWKDYVKAKLLWEEYNDSKKNHTYDSLAEIYGGPGFGKGKIVEFIKTFEIIMEYVRQSPNEDDAIATALENFIWFQQLQRSNRDEIRNDDEFQKAVFKNIREENIARTDQLKNLRHVHRFKDSWSAFKRGEVDRAHELCRLHLREEQDNPDPDLLMADVNIRLEAVLKEKSSLAKVSSAKLIEFHQLAEQVPGQIDDVNLRASYVIERLDSITSAELASLSTSSLSKLRFALDRVIRQAEATSSRR